MSSNIYILLDIPAHQASQKYMWGQVRKVRRLTFDFKFLKNTVVTREPDPQLITGSLSILPAGAYVFGKCAAVTRVARSRIIY